MGILEYHLERGSRDSDGCSWRGRGTWWRGGRGGEDGGDELHWDSQVVDGDEADQVSGLECVSRFHH